MPLVQAYTNAQLIPAFPNHACLELPVNLAPGTYARGTVLGEVTATPGTFKAYAAAATDGSQNPKCVLQYPCVVDAGGNITGIGEYGLSTRSAPAYVTGIFRCEELVGLDANTVTKLGGCVVRGDVTNGIFRF